MMSPARSRSTSWQTALVLLLSAALLAWFLRGIDRHGMMAALRDARLSLIVAAVIVTALTYVFRAWRWQALLAPLGGASFRNSFRITVMGFTATNLLPGRLGEVLRPYLISRAEPVSGPAAFATILIERVLDLTMVMVLFGIFLATARVDVGREVKGAGVVTATASVVALVIMAFGAGQPERHRRLADLCINWMPARIAAVLRSFAHTLVDGLAVMRQPRPLFVAVAMSAGLWISIAWGIWLVSLALDVTMAFTASFLIVTYLVVGVAVPVPAGVGSFHFMYQLAAASVLGADRNHAAAAAIVLHLASVLPISLLGLGFMAQDGWTLARLRGVEPDGGLK